MGSKMPRKKRSLWREITNIKSLDREEYVKLIHRAGTFAVLGFFLSFLVFIGVAVFGGFTDVISRIASANPSIYALSFVAVFLGFIVRYGKWSYYMRMLKLKVPPLKSLAVYLSIYSMDLTPGRVGRIAAAYTLKRITNIKFMNIVPIITMDIFTDFLGSSILSLAAALYMRQYVIYVIALNIILLLPFVFLLHDWAYKRLKVLLKKWKRVESFSLYGDEYYASQSALNKPKVYLISVLFTLPAAVLNAMALYFALAAMGVKSLVPQSIFVFSIADITGMASTLPGNIGVTDGVLVALVGSLYKLTSTASSAVTIMTRTASLWFGVMLGAAMLLYTMRYWKPKSARKRGKRRN